MTGLATCRVCSAPLVPLPDLPDAHPGCAPVDAPRWEAVTGSGPRTYVGAMRALVWSMCAGCDRRIEVNDQQVLTTIDGRRVWACVACSTVSAPESAPVAPLSVPNPLPRLRTSPERSGASEGASPTAPRRAAA